MTPELQTAILFTLLAASTYRGLRAEHAKIRDGYTEKFTVPLDQYVEDNADGFMRRQAFRLARVQALLSGG